MYKNNRHPGECLHHDGIKILNIFTFSQTDCGADNFAALVFFCRDIKNNSLTLIFICLNLPQLRDHCGIFLFFLPLPSDNHHFPV
ncbi:TPA: hypothetical protein ACHY66_005518, partial [Escherichia coli]